MRMSIDMLYIHTHTSDGVTKKKELNIRKSYTMNKNNPACRLYAASSRMFSGLHADSKISLIRL